MSALPLSASALLAFLVLAAAYLLGSIPFAIVVSRVFGLADPRSFGSGNPGATNVLRSGNRLAALLTLIGDASKGAVAVLLCRTLAESLALGPALPAWAGAAAFAGHLYPVFLRFRGGKGVATFLGTLLALIPIVGLATCVLWLGVAVLFRYSSLASVVSVICASFSLLGIPTPPGAAAAVTLMSALVLWRHRKNLAQLAAGTETRIGGRAAAQSADGTSSAGTNGGAHGRGANDGTGGTGATGANELAEEALAGVATTGMATGIAAVADRPGTGRAER